MFNKIKFKMREHLPKSQKTNKLIKAAICFLIAILAAASVYISAQQKVETIQVVKTKATVSAGTKITESDVQLVEAVKYGLPDDVITSQEQVIGKYTTTDIYPSDFIIPAKLSASLKNPFDSLPSDKIIVSFTVSNLAASVANNIRAGDTIQVVYAESFIDPTGLSNFLNPIEPDCLKRLKVLDIKDSNGYSIGAAKEGNSIYNTSAQFIPSVVTVMADEVQAAELYKAELKGNIYTRFIER